LQQFLVAGQVGADFGEQGKRESMRPLPGDQGWQELLHFWCVADKIVINDEE